MKFWDLLQFAMGDILRNGRKSFLSVLAIAIGIFAVVLISAAGQLVSNEVETRVSETGLGGLTIFPSKTGQGTISELQIEKMETSISGLRAATPFCVKNAVLSHRGAGRSAALIGVNGKIGEIFELRLLHGRMFTTADIAAGKPCLLIDDVLARTLYERENIVGKELVLYIDDVRIIGEVVGIIASQKQGLEGLLGVSLPNMIYIPYSVLDQVNGKGQTEQIAISCFAGYDENVVAQAAVRYLNLENQIKYKFENLNQYISGLKEIMDILELFIRGVAAVSLLVGSLGIMNCMLYTVDARRTEIGVCKALGEQRSSILKRFVAEAVILCILGSLCGIGAIAIVFGILRHMTGLRLVLHGDILLQTIGLSMLCGVFSGILPACRAARLDPIDVIER